MAYEHRPGSFSLFKNKYKTTDKHPDYRGEGKDLEGNPIEVAAWLKESANGKFMSCKISEPRERRERKPSPAENTPLDDDIPW